MLHVEHRDGCAHMSNCMFHTNSREVGFKLREGKCVRTSSCAKDGG